MDYQNLSQSLTIANEYKKKYDELNRENTLLLKQNDDLNRTVGYLKEQNKRNNKIIEYVLILCILKINKYLKSKNYNQYVY